MAEYEKNLSGKVEYSYSKNQQKKIDGTIKLQKDPKYEPFDISNIIQKGSILCYTDWF